LSNFTVKPSKAGRSLPLAGRRGNHGGERNYQSRGPGPPERRATAAAAAAAAAATKCLPVIDLSCTNFHDVQDEKFFDNQSKY